VANIFGNWLYGMDVSLLGWERLLLYGRFGSVEMTKFLMIKVALSYR
jgi:hypothetical protein